jgi:RNA recognition motif-containing protein
LSPQFRPALLAYPNCSALKSNKEKTMKNIFVGNLSFGSTDQDIRALFEVYGAVDRVSIVTDRESGQPRGFGFVEMGDDGQGERAISGVNGQELGGRALTVNEAKPKTGGGGGGGRDRNRGGGGGRW